MNVFEENSELRHYGILGMKWGIRRYQPYPDGKKNGKEIGEAAKAARAAKLKKHYDKAVTKLDDFSTKYHKQQSKADKAYAKAEKKLNGFFGSPEKAKEFYKTANEYQFKANKISYKGKKWYEAMIKNFGSLKISSINPSSLDKGREFVERSLINSALASSNYMHDKFK